LPAPKGYFQLIREICNEYEILFIVDEVMTGIGRTGKKWGIEHWDVEPDLIAVAKGLSGGYIPLGACIVSDSVAETFQRPFAHGHTYGSHPVSCAVGLAVLDYVEKHKLVERSANLGKYFHEELNELYDHPTVGDIRGMGIFSGIEFVKDKATKKPFQASVAYHRRVLEYCFDKGLLVYPGLATVDGVTGDHIQVAPPLIVTKEQIDDIVSILDEAIGEAERRAL
jgi:adenosylmethionine-8-amino-7-oxononanoate aminotransferase